MNAIAPAGIGDNRAPLAEEIADETAPFRERRDALLKSVNDSKIASPEDAAQVTTLGNMLKELFDKVEVARKARAEPFDTGKAAVQRAFKAEILDALSAGMTQARQMIDAWRRQQERDAEAERRRRAEEAAAAQAAADKLAQQKRDAEMAGDSGAALKAEIAEVQARDRAEALNSDQGVIRPGEIIHTSTGAAITSKQVTGKIDNIGLFLAWLIRNDAKWLSETLQPRADRHIRSGLSVDGVSRVETQGTRFRR